MVYSLLFMVYGGREVDATVLPFPFRATMNHEL
jgi:hypothetical protein